jgi:hypothetical protein
MKHYTVTPQEEQNKHVDMVQRNNEHTLAYIVKKA